MRVINLADGVIFLPKDDETHQFNLPQELPQMNALVKKTADKAHAAHINIPIHVTLPCINENMPQAT